MAEVKPTDIYEHYSSAMIYDPSRIFSLLPGLLDEGDIIETKNFNERWISCSGCGASRIQEKECEYCGRKH